jgi:hypothetical protein
MLLASRLATRLAAIGAVVVCGALLASPAYAGTRVTGVTVNDGTRVTGVTVDDGTRVTGVTVDDGTRVTGVTVDDGTRVTGVTVDDGTRVTAPPAFGVGTPPAL